MSVEKIGGFPKGKKVKPSRFTTATKMVHSHYK